MVKWIVQNTRVILFLIVKWHANALWSHRRDISLCIVSRHATTLNKNTRTFLECKEKTILEWSRNSPDINPIENVSNMMQKEISNQMLCKRRYVKRVCKAWYSVAPNVLEEFYNSIPWKIADLIKAKEGAIKY